ncbi:hypothetical protein BIFGAL_03398 [Bifidobacterium gallicum DSM 20093 = LMG 11596]|uniref:Uncharacterized protein n=1 Tax=Bifidobacterium gallicum DSM 20093 = LMG 11596 TaxID=561180 RepID=D1NU76_9BIFI|nr:hypothetical protein BIFGAL_03398 [Bifidobacterium gallicum DSM 20093 = LMG 11596]
MGDAVARGVERGSPDGLGGVVGGNNAMEIILGFKLRVCTCQKPCASPLLSSGVYGKVRLQAS